MSLGSTRLCMSPSNASASYFRAREGSEGQPGYQTSSLLLGTLRAKPPHALGLFFCFFFSCWLLTFSRLSREPER